ncbi:MAG: hypothetical protein K6E98_03560, partial [Lachnospiraceae bacterium]|nr:hypothetical protein [Lachnospiraceae bacterium]
GRYIYKEYKYAGNELHSDQEGNDKIREYLSSDIPFAYCRYSFTEMEIMRRSVNDELFHIPITHYFDWLDIFCKPGENESLGSAKYTELMKDAFKKADILGVWRNLHMGDALLYICDISSNVYISKAQGLEAFRYENPWSEKLKGKKVLVVSPFSEAIKHQYSRRNLLWENKNVLPEFKLETEDAIWYYAGKRDERFKDWFEAFDYLYDTIMSHDFDVAILGCGYFGFALAAKIKEAGRQAIHMGGATQLLFGIKGKRWDNHPVVSKYYNEYWIRPDEDLKPADDKNLDDGCYW